MAILKSKDISKMKNEEINEKLKELQSQLIRERANLAKGGKIKIKEMKKTIARLHTFNRLNEKSVEVK